MLPYISLESYPPAADSPRARWWSRTYVWPGTHASRTRRP